MIRLFPADLDQPPHSMFEEWRPKPGRHRLFDTDRLLRVEARRKPIGFVQRGWTTIEESYSWETPFGRHTRYNTARVRCWTPISLDKKVVGEQYETLDQAIEALASRGQFLARRST